MPHRIFLPRKKQRSKFLSLGSLLFINIILLSIVGLRLFSLNVKDLNILGFATDIRISELLDDTNIERQKAGLPTLKYNETLAKAANRKAANMFSENYWAHIAPSGKTPWDFILGENYKYTYAGENLAKDFQKSNSVVDAWMNSPTHKENILNTHYTEVGFAIVNGELQGKETTLVVQMFGTPYITTVSKDSAGSVPDTSVMGEKTSQVKEATVPQAPDTRQVLKDSSEVHNLININPTFITYFSYLLLIVFMFSLFVDGLLAYKRHYLRLTGNTISHLIMFVGVLLFIYYIKHPTIV